MIRRILAGAAIAAVALGLSATAASADQHNPHNSGHAVLSQFQIIDDALNNVLNHSLNDSIRDIEITGVQLAELQEINLDVLSNYQPKLGNYNKDSSANAGGLRS
ncbi:hypothetical protein ETD86_22590 [Nonomuraea turkmeniaca]|uniref:Uncharacterized protein n=1 Tax=Nonomuraea turkmeniaca TaxID=103838 RepID=A0A5S4FFB0_9ACTN|nr:hypothetical protein [Nonomuraea turkmeniaca]TMR17915.1 hypothetical protein ETD86_22590 [Nonomuraea turkmeniaca]